MAECNACGARVSPGELFCGNCGTQQISNSPELKTVAANLSEPVEVQPETPPISEPPVKEVPVEEPPAEESPAEEPPVEEPPAEEESVEETPAPEMSATLEPAPISSESLGGSFTDNVQDAGTGTPQRSTGGGHRANVKQLDPGTILNHRYEIVRRIGGGGMGAVYLAKDRNLGDAPRAVKEMVESHLDPTQHEKAIGDFKRESLLLTALEHPSIPTIYDYFYDEALGRFYLVMKYISGGDHA